MRKKIKPLEYWRQQEELFAQESNHGIPNTTFELAEVDGVPSNTQDEDIRAQSARSQRNTGHAKVLKRHL